MPQMDLNNPKLTFFQRKFLSLYGQVYVGSYQKKGWTAPIEHYAFKCKKHGVVIDYPHGHSQILTCPKCREEQE